MTKKPLFAGTIEDQMYFNEEYINKVLSLVEKQQHGLLNLESDNLLDILTRHADHVFKFVEKGVFLERVKEYFTENCKVTRSYEIVDTISKIQENKAGIK